jgi:hypothetical protein
MPRGCSARTLDVFVTKDDDGYTYDDTFVCPVLSVDVKRPPAGEVAYIKRHPNDGIDGLATNAATPAYVATTMTIAPEGSGTPALARVLHCDKYLTTDRRHLAFQLLHPGSGYSSSDLNYRGNGDNTGAIDFYSQLSGKAPAVVTGADATGVALEVSDGNKNYVEVVDEATEWIMPMQPRDHPEQVGLDVGDLVRVGAVGSDGYTDYLTVVEKVVGYDLRNSVVVGTGADSWSPAIQITSDFTQAFVITDATDTFDLVGHGLAIDDKVLLTDLVTSTGVTTDTEYYVHSTGFTADTLRLKATISGTVITIGTGDGTANLAKVGGTLHPAWIARVAGTAKPAGAQAFVITNATDTFDLVGHGLAIGDKVLLSSLATSTGVTTDTYYWVHATGFTADKVRLTSTILGSVIIIGTGDGTADLTFADLPTSAFADQFTYTSSIGDWAPGERSSEFGSNTDGNTPFFCYRLNHAINATKVSARRGFIDAKERNSIGARSFIRRRDVPAAISTINPAGAGLLYPMYKVNKWLTGRGDLRVKLDHGVKILESIKLVGYSVINKRHVGFSHGHEMIGDDFIIVRIDEVAGGVVSNNRHADGSFAVLHCGSGAQDTEGAIEYSRFDKDGVAEHVFDNHMNVVRNLTLKFLDRQGNPAHFGRIHLWFELQVAHG